MAKAAWFASNVNEAPPQLKETYVRREDDHQSLKIASIPRKRVHLASANGANDSRQLESRTQLLSFPIRVSGMGEHNQSYLRHTRKQS